MEARLPPLSPRRTVAVQRAELAQGAPSALGRMERSCGSGGRGMSVRFWGRRLVPAPRGRTGGSHELRPGHHRLLPGRAPLPGGVRPGGSEERLHRGEWASAGRRAGWPREGPRWGLSLAALPGLRAHGTSGIEREGKGGPSRCDLLLEICLEAAAAIGFSAGLGAALAITVLFRVDALLSVELWLCFGPLLRCCFGECWEVLGIESLTRRLGIGTCFSRGLDNHCTHRLLLAHGPWHAELAELPQGGTKLQRSHGRMNNPWAPYSACGESGGILHLCTMQIATGLGNLAIKTCRSSLLAYIYPKLLLN